MNKKRNKVQVLIINAGRDKALLLQTNQRRGQFWQNLTGGVDEGETLDAGAQRELFEETGFELSQGELKRTDLIFEFTDQYQSDVTEYCYTFVLNSPGLSPKIDPGEHDQFAWKDIASLTESDYGFPSNYQLLIHGRKLLERNSL